jgi:hypothetical protein
MNASKWEDIIPLLKSFNTVIVSGCQRSGTNIATKILAEELGYQYICETQMVDWNLITKNPERGRGRVIHSPMNTHKLVQSSAAIGIVFMIRDHDDILASIKKLWRRERSSTELNEIAKYRGLVHYDDMTRLPEVKYKYWYEVQKPALEGRGFELDYQSLSSHPLWIDKELRTKFKSRQIS